MTETKYKIGDLVRAKGYEDRIFQVEAYIISEHYGEGGHWKDVTYDLTDVVTFEYTIAFQEDLTLLAEADGAYEYLKKNKPSETTSLREGTYNDFLNEIVNIAEVINDEKKARIQEEKRSRMAETNRIDYLLDEYNDIKRLIGEFGDDDENDFAAKLDEIERKLKEASDCTTEHY